MGRDSSVGIATRYGLDGPGSNPDGGRDCPHPGAHPASYTMSTGSSPGLKWPGCGVDHPPASRAEVKERVELYLYSPFGLRSLFFCSRNDIMKISPRGVLFKLCFPKYIVETYFKLAVIQLFNLNYFCYFHFILKF